MTDEEIRQFVTAHPEWSESDVEWEMARMDFYKSVRLSIPENTRILKLLSDSGRDALRTSYRDREGYRVTDKKELRALQALGLAGLNGPYLTAYGTTARNALLAEDTRV